MSHFAKLPQAPLDPILGISVRFKEDTYPDKVDLGVGAYKTEDGKPYVFRAVRKAEEEIHNLNLNHEYAPIDGDARLQPLCRELLLGEGHPALERTASVQAISGTGAIRLALDFITMLLPPNRSGKRVFWVSDPTWTNHIGLGEATGFHVKKYRYYNKETRSSDIAGMIKDLEENTEEGDCVCLQACAHNPTGHDPSREDWVRILDVVRKKKMIVLLDSAYQGFASGTFEPDGYVMRRFAEGLPSLFIAQSFAKNMGLYGERFGMLHAVTASKDEAKIVMSQLKIVVRRCYSSPPIHPARIAYYVLSDSASRATWLKELKGVAERIKEMRVLLRREVEALGTPGDWSHITDQIGMFSFLAITPEESQRLVDVHHIYVVGQRISLSGVNKINVKYIARAVNEVRNFCKCKM